MTTTLIVASIFSAIVLAGNIIFDKKRGAPVDWKRTLIVTGIAFGLTLLIGIATE